MIDITSQQAFIEHLSQYRTPIANAFFLFLNFFDTDYFYLLLVPLIWVIFGKKFGSRIVFMIILSAFCNNALKEFFALPRPCQINPSVGLIALRSYSFPSGAAQASMLISLLTYFTFKKRVLLPFLVLYVALISFSRLYLGVHYPIDIFGGWVIGILLFLFYRFIYMPIEKKIETPFAHALSIIGFFVFLLVINHSINSVRLILIATGIAMGRFILDIKDMDIIRARKISIRIVEVLISLLLIAFAYSLTKLLPIENRLLRLSLASWILGFALSFVSIWVSNLLLKQYQKR